MIPHLFFYQLVLLGLLWLFFMLHAACVRPARGLPLWMFPVTCRPVQGRLLPIFPIR